MTYFQGRSSELGWSISFGLALSYTGCVTFCEPPPSLGTLWLLRLECSSPRESLTGEGDAPIPQPSTPPRFPPHLRRGCQPPRDHPQETFSALRQTQCSGRETERTQRGGGMGRCTRPQSEVLECQVQGSDLVLR